MLNKNIENPIAKTLYIGAPFITLLVSANTNMDPVNAPKALALGAFAFAAIAVTIFSASKMIWNDAKLPVVVMILFVLSALSCVIFSVSPIEQLLYGVGGRNTGFITYLSLVFLSLSALTIRTSENFRKVIYGFLFAGLVNFFYNLVVLFGNDPIPWTNTYATILGTFGNPNFISSFMGIFVSVLTAFLFHKKASLSARSFVALLIVVSIYQIKQSNSLQGLLVSGLGIAIVLYFFLRSNINKSYYSIAYLFFVIVIGLFTIAGMLQKGPLVEYVYKRTVSLRGEYWHAGLNMANANPFTGVGMDSYGLWFRRMRNPSALISPGPEIITNSAHNVFIDIFSSGGAPLLLSYLGFVFLVAVTIFKIIKRSKHYDPIFIALLVGWVGYHAQAFISINQIGLAIWGWLFGGLIIAYEIASRNPNFYGIDLELKRSSKRNKRGSMSTSETPAGVTLVAILGFAIGIVVASPPAIADARWRSALTGSTIEKIEVALESWPRDSSRLAQGTSTLSDNKLDDLAYKYAKKGVEFNPEYFDAWRLLATMKLATEADKKLAAENLHRLDPKNPTYKLVQ
jgi:O-antigen ligase